MPVQYAGVTEEHHAVRNAAGLFDVSHMGEMILTGRYAGEVVNYLITNDASRLVDGQALYTCACNEAGTILDDLIVYRVEQERWLVVCNASNRAKMVAHFQRACVDHCDFEDASDRTALIALQGPRAIEIATQAGAHVADLRSFFFRDTDIAGVPCAAARTGYTGEDGLEIFCPTDGAATLWRALMAAGTPLGLQAAGLGARDTLRLEARLSLYGNDIDETTNPLEAGLGWVVKLNKELFVGKESLARIKEAGLTRKMVGFEMTGRGIARHGYPIVDASGQAVGICTSGSPSPTTGKNIGLGYVPTGMSEIGTPIQVDCRGRVTAAVIVKTPFYKRAAAG